MKVEIIEFKPHGDDRGLLVSVEGAKDVPFDIKRVYYITGVSGNTRRGFHAHKQLKQVLVCVSGSVKIMLDDGSEKTDVLLSKPYEGLVVGEGIWHEMYDFSDNAVLLVFASEHYDESDYIRNYEDFLTYIRR